MLKTRFSLPNISIVFNGGGSRGPFQFGVYLALTKYHLNKNIVATSGASIGSFSEVFFHLNDPIKILNIWRQVNNDLVRGELNHSNLITSVAKVLLSKKGNGYYSTENIRAFLENLNVEPLLKNTYPTYVSLAKCIKNKRHETTSYETEYIKINDLNSHEIINYLLATSAIPFVFDEVKINDSFYVDPMKADNEPVTPLLNHDTDFILIVPLNDSHYSKAYPKDFPYNIIDFAYPPLLKEKKLKMLDFSVKNQDKYISMGYQVADLLLGKIKQDKQLHHLSKKEKKLPKTYYSLSYYNIEDISFKQMEISDIFADINKNMSKKEQIQYEA